METLVYVVLAIGSLAAAIVFIGGIVAPNLTRAAWQRNVQGGDPNPQMVCPHCQVRGQVVSSPITVKAGISGGKATAAVLSGGVSVLATGLSRKTHVTSASCQNCHNTWTF